MAYAILYARTARYLSANRSRRQSGHASYSTKVCAIRKYRAICSVTSFVVVDSSDLIDFILLQLQIKRVPYSPDMDWKDSLTLSVPLMHVIPNNRVQLVLPRDNSLSPITSAINDHLRRFYEYNHHHNECSLFPAVRDLLMNFTPPDEMAEMPQQPGMPLQPGMPNQMHAPPPVGANPNQMMHAPMQPVCYTF